MNKSIKLIAASALIPFNLAIGSNNFDNEETVKTLENLQSNTITDNTRVEEESKNQTIINNLDSIIALPESTELRDIRIAIAKDPTYFMCCPAQNAERFAEWLVTQRSDTKNITVKKATKKYKIYLKKTYKKDIKKIISNNNNNTNTDTDTYADKINKILPFFKDMYNGIIKPFIDIAAQTRQSPNKRHK